MYTLFIVGFLASLSFYIYSRATLNRRALNFGLWVFVASFLLCAVSGYYSSNIVQEDYIEIENYSYVTEEGAIETLEGPFYTKDGAYYKKDMSRANWIPFAPCDFVAIDLPKSATTNNPTANTLCYMEETVWKSY